MSNVLKLIEEKTLLKSIKRLATILEEENTHLEKMDIGFVNNFMEEKLALIIYMSQVKELLAKNPEIKAQFSEISLNKIKTSYLKLEEIMAQNLALINYGRAAHRRIIESFKKAHKKQNSVVTYNKNRRKKEEVEALSIIQKI